MAKKAVDAANEAYKSKGMKAPRPEGFSPAKPSPSDAPAVHGSHDEKHDPHTADMEHKPAEHQQSEAPKSKGAAQKPADAKSPFKGVNEGEKMDIKEHYHNPLAKD